MTAFSLVLNRLFPLYFIVAAGFVGGRYLQVRKESIARLLIYLISPVVVFYGTCTAQLVGRFLALPFLFFALCCFMCLIFFALARAIWRDQPITHLTAFAAGDANTGYFGLPVAIALFGEDSMSVVILAAFGFIFFENTLGFFITARGHHTARESLGRVLRLPSVYAFALGLLCNVAGLRPSIHFEELIRNVRGAYSVLGMMMIGLGVSQLSWSRSEQKIIDAKFLALCLFAKFVVWPALVFGIIQIDSTFVHALGPDAYRVMALLSMVPLAANTVAIATELRVEPEKAAVAVLLSTLVALFYIPYMVSHWIPL